MSKSNPPDYEKSTHESGTSTGSASPIAKPIKWPRHLVVIMAWLVFLFITITYFGPALIGKGGSSSLSAAAPWLIVIAQKEKENKILFSALNACLNMGSPFGGGLIAICNGPKGVLQSQLPGFGNDTASSGGSGSSGAPMERRDGATSTRVDTKYINDVAMPSAHTLIIVWAYFLLLIFCLTCIAFRAIPQDDIDDDLSNENRARSKQEGTSWYTITPRRLIRMAKFTSGKVALGLNVACNVVVLIVFGLCVKGANIKAPDDFTVSVGIGAWLLAVVAFCFLPIVAVVSFWKGIPVRRGVESDNRA